MHCCVTAGLVLASHADSSTRSPAVLTQCTLRLPLDDQSEGFHTNTGQMASFSGHDLHVRQATTLQHIVRLLLYSTTGSSFLINTYVTAIQALSTQQHDKMLEVSHSLGVDGVVRTLLTTWRGLLQDGSCPHTHHARSARLVTYAETRPELWPLCHLSTKTPSIPMPNGKSISQHSLCSCFPHAIIIQATAYYKFLLHKPLIHFFTLHTA